MPVNFLNLPGLDVVDFRETATDYHVRAKPKVVSRQCPSCGPAGKVDTIPGKLNLQLKRERKLLTMRQHELTDFQWLAASGWLNNFPQLQAAYELKERYFRIWDCATPGEALAEYLRWQESIPDDLAKPFRAITTAWRIWRKQILAYFECPITNAFTESFNSKIRKAYQEGTGYSFEVLRAKVLFSDMLQKKARRVETVKVKKGHDSMMCRRTPVPNDGANDLC